MYESTRPGWNVETTHPVEEAEGVTVCETCLNGIEPAIAFAEDWGSVAHGAETTDSDGTTHLVVVRKIIEE